MNKFKGSKIKNQKALKYQSNNLKYEDKFRKYAVDK